MAQKPKIEYVGRSYIFGTEAPKVAQPRKTLRSRLPEIKLERFQKIYIDPLGMLGLAAAVCVLVLMLAGAVHMRSTRAEYDQIKTYLSELKRDNAMLSHVYHTSYDLEEIHTKALKIGMVEGENAERFTIFFSVPEQEQKPTAWDDFVWLVSGLLSNPRRG